MDIKINLSQTLLTTPRLLLRPWRESDAQDFFAYASVPGVGEMAGWPHHTDKAQSLQMLRSFILQGNVLALECRESGKTIGSLGLHVSRFNNHPLYGGLRQKEVGYVLAKEAWGQGLMPEAVRALITHAFSALDLEALSVGHFTDNLRSRRVIEKCGFTFVEDAVYFAKQLGQSIPDKGYILLREDVQERSSL